MVVTEFALRCRRALRSGVFGLLLALGAPGCGLLSGPDTDPNAPPPVVLHARHLPEPLRFVELGATTPERVQAEFRDQHLYVVSSVGREERVSEWGPNTGRPYASVTVTRQELNGLPVGQLGDDFTLTFEFTSFEPDGEGPLRLFGLKVSQPMSAASACRDAQELAAREGLDRCHEESVYSPGAPTREGYFHACVYDEDDLPVEVRCAPSPSGDARLFSVTATLGREGNPEPPAPVPLEPPPPSEVPADVPGEPLPVDTTPAAEPETSPDDPGLRPEPPPA